MADYWKSQPRHFCDFCKCWIADNKPSKDFHEKGKKHQVNVEKRIAEVRKKGIKKAEKEEEENSTLKQIEKAALKALKEDLKRDPSLASQYGVEFKESALPKLAAPVNRPAPSKQAKKFSQPGPSSVSEPSPVDSNIAENETTRNEQAEASGETQTNSKDWQEAKSPEGYTYYWNTVTNEVTWIKPEGYVSPEDQENTEEEQSTEQSGPDLAVSSSNPVSSSEEPAPESLAVAPEPVIPEPLDIQSIPLPGDIASIPLPGEVVPAEETEKEDPQKEEDEEEKIEEPPAPRPERPKRINPYGAWETAEQPEEEAVDLQLPEKKEQQVAKVITISEPKIKFREKKVDILGAELVAFKKRKLNSAAKLRKREEDS